MFIYSGSLEFWSPETSKFFDVFWVAEESSLAWFRVIYLNYATVEMLEKLVFSQREICWLNWVRQHFVAWFIQFSVEKTCGWVWSWKRIDPLWLISIGCKCCICLVIPLCCDVFFQDWRNYRPYLTTKDKHKLLMKAIFFRGVRGQMFWYFTSLQLLWAMSSVVLNSFLLTCHNVIKKFLIIFLFPQNKHRASIVIRNVLIFVQLVQHPFVELLFFFKIWWKSQRGE